MKLKYYILTFLLLAANLLFADGVKFTVSVSKNQVGTGEQFEVTFSINGNGDNFTPPAMSGFQLLSGPNISQSMSSINGSTSVSSSYSYDLLAVKEGEFTIGPATIVADGRKYSTNPVKIKVVKGQPVPQNTQQNQGGTASPANSDLSKSLFVRSAVDKNTVYQGEQIILNYRLYTLVGIEQYQVDKLPDLNGFWNEDIRNLQQQLQAHIENYKGVKYDVADIKQSILFPEHSGNITIDPFLVTFIAKVRAPSNDPMDAFFGGSFNEVKYQAKSSPVVIKVKPLPDAGKPDSFTGAVGKFSVETSLDKTDVKANDAINYRVKVTGSGNIKLLKNLSVVFPADFEKYDPKIEDTVTETENGVSGSRIYNYLLIPRHGGEYTIDPLKFSYFNPVTGKYISLSAGGFKVKVAKGANESNVTAFAADKQDVKVLDKDIRYIKTSDGSLSKVGDQFYGSIVYILLLLVGPILCIGAFIYRNRMREFNSDQVRVRSTRAGKVAAKHLASAQLQLNAKNTKAFYEDIFKGLYGYISDKLNIPYANLDRETIASALKNRSVSDQLVSRLLDTLDLCEMARYAPVTHISEQEVFDKAKGIINDIENEI